MRVGPDTNAQCQANPAFLRRTGCLLKPNLEQSSRATRNFLLEAKANEGHHRVVARLDAGERPSSELQ
jgi:hypothetical protein